MKTEENKALSIEEIENLKLEVERLRVENQKLRRDNEVYHEVIKYISISAEKAVKEWGII